MSRQRSARSAALGLTVRRVPSTIPSRSAGTASSSARRRRPRPRVARPHLGLVPFGRERPAQRRPVGRRDGAAAVRGRSRARRPAVPRRVQLGRQPAHRALRGRTAPRAENRELLQRAIQSEFALQENALPAGAARLHRRPALPGRLQSRRRRGDRSAGRRFHAGDRRRRRDRGRRAPERPGRHRRRARRTRDAGHARRSRACSCSPTRTAAASAIDLRTGATGIVRHARGTRETLVLDRVRKQDVVRVKDRDRDRRLARGGAQLALPEGDPDRRASRASARRTPISSSRCRSTRTWTSARSTP